MTSEPQAGSSRPSQSRALLSPLALLAAVFMVELFVSRMLPHEATTRYSWAGHFWYPTWWEWVLFVLINLVIARAAAGSLTSDLAGRLSLRARRGVMTAGLCAAGLLGAQALYGWLLLDYEGGRYVGAEGLPGIMGHVTIVFQAFVGFMFLRWTASRLGILGRSRGASRARTASLALLVALGARTLAFETGTMLPALSVVVGLTAMLYVVYQVARLERPTELLLAESRGENASPQL